MWASVIRFTRTIHASVENLLYHMMQQGQDAGMVQFKTNGKRPCVLVLGIGPDAAKDVMSLYRKLEKKGNKDNGNNQTTEDRSPRR